MNVIEIVSLRPPGGGSPRFEGLNYSGSIAFFVVTSPPGHGADKHRHPYDETFILLDGMIDVIVNGEMRKVESGHILVIPANAWHEFKNCSDKPLCMINIHPVPKMIQEDWIGQ